MKLLFDTSVLMPALMANHPSHAVAFSAFQVAEQENVQGYLSTHSLAELYSVMTGIPKPLRATPDEAQLLILQLLEILEPVSLTVEDYRLAIANAVSLQLVSGVVFDAIIAQAALKAGVDQLITLNPKDFRRLGDDISALVRVPE